MSPSPRAWPPAKTGKYEAGMGVDAADVDGDGWLDIYVTHLDFELNRLYHNNHDESFDDATFSSGLGNKATLPKRRQRQDV